MSTAIRLCSDVCNNVSQRCYFRYSCSTAAVVYAIGAIVSNFSEFTGAITNMPNGYGMQSTGKFLVPYEGVWLFHWDLYYNSACGFVVKTDQAKVTNIYGNAANFDNQFYNGSTQNGALHATIAGSGGENTTSIMIPIYLQKGSSIWLEKSINAANQIYTYHCAFTGVFLSTMTHFTN